MTDVPVRLVVDRAACAGHGMCYGIAPSLVEPDEQGDPVVLIDPISPAQWDDAHTAVSVCPERALSLVPASSSIDPEESSR
ncbi:ferredoxin [Nocardia bovistercoris]|uniref:Ferredoxin n=1 Tax=Nocardia bovistercoris TaxID=2785916 RepID=A0A931IA41_9NOCA|nr:ferredoxin [Nocardia bovistercoris]MBH0776683.1 ferredoxin [Nocardia bovistercoris]